MRDCPFCRIVAGDAPAQVIYQGEEVTAFRDIRPQAPTHLLVVPNRHIAGVADVDPADEALLGKMILLARQLAQEQGLDAGYRLVINNGRQGGQTVFHLHIHLLGGRLMGWPPG
jgi:histidine triad (HIT) family protein